MVGLHQLRHRGLLPARGGPASNGGVQLLPGRSAAATGRCAAERRLLLRLHLSGGQQVGLRRRDDPVQSGVVPALDLPEHPAAALPALVRVSVAQLGAEQQRLRAGLDLLPHRVLRGAAVMVAAVAALHPGVRLWPRVRPLTDALRGRRRAAACSRSCQDGSRRRPPFLWKNIHSSGGKGGVQGRSQLL